MSEFRVSSFVVLALSMVAGCYNPPNSLEGSIDQSFSLEFDSVKIRKQDKDLLIEYIKELAGGGTNKVCKLIINTEDMPLADDTNITGETFLDRVRIKRVANTGGDFPPASGGEVRFDSYDFQAGGYIGGEFDAVFDNGHSLLGKFEGSVQIVNED